MSKTKILMTCRQVVFRNETLLKSFLLTQENTINLHNKDNELTYQDKLTFLKSYGLEETILTRNNPAKTSKMFPLLCKLFSSEQEFKRYGSNFFISPVRCLIEELDEMQKRNRIQYVSLVLLIASQNKLSKHMFDDEKQTQTNFHTMKRKALSFFKVPRSTDGFEFIDALTEMGGTYTKTLCVDCDRSCDCEFSFIHDYMFEIAAYHIGNQFPELILKCMSSDFVANKIKINQQHHNDTTDEKKNVIDLCITLSEPEFHLLAERMWTDVKEWKFYVFAKIFLKHLPVLLAFKKLMETKKYDELHSVFLSELTKISNKDRNVLTQNCFKENVNKLVRKDNYLKNCILKLLLDVNSKVDTFPIILEDTRVSVRAISWVICFGHHAILQSLIDQIKEKEEKKVNDLYQNSYNTPHEPYTDSHQGGTVTKVEGAVESVIVEQCRLLCLGCISGDLDTVKILLRNVEKKAINTRLLRRQFNSFNFTPVPLAFACYLEYPNIVAELITAGADVNPTYSALALHPLNVACKNGNSEIIETLINAGAQINDKPCIDSPLIVAICNQHLNAVDQLIKAGAGVNYSTGDYKPLKYACENGNLNIVKKLLIAGSDINPTIPTSESFSKPSTNFRFIDVRLSTHLDLPLTIACRRGHRSVVQELIDNEADVNKVDNLVTPLGAACFGRYQSLIDLLVNAGAVTTEVPNVMYPLHTRVFLKLIGLGICVTKNDIGKASLMAACAQGQLDLAEKKITEGADVNLIDEEKTPLIVACYFGNLNVVERLIKAGADVNLGNGFITPLQVACFVGHLSIVSELLKQGADINLTCKYVTALTAACYFGHLDIVKILIDSGADINPEGWFTQPIYIAIHRQVRDVLLKAGAVFQKLGDHFAFGDTSFYFH